MNRCSKKSTPRAIRDLQIVWSVLLLAAASIASAQTTKLDHAAPGIKVECRGVLRDGVVAIGGETTGTTISFGRMTWDLSLNDDAKKAFAKEHNKQQIVVTGTLKKVTGTQIPVRWVIEVDQFSEPKETGLKPMTSVTVTGKLRSAEGSDAQSAVFIESHGVVWPLEFADQHSLDSKAQKLLQKSVMVRGTFQQTEIARPSQLLIHVKELEAAPAK